MFETQDLKTNEQDLNLSGKWAETLTRLNY